MLWELGVGSWELTRVTFVKMTDSRDPAGTPPHVVIIGAGFGGLYAALALKSAPVRITVIDRKNHHLFQPLLYQVAMAALSPGDIASPIRWILRRQRNVEVLLAEATAIDTASQTVRLADGEIGYDYLIVATGSTHAYFGHDEWGRLTPGLKTLEDALEIRSRVLITFELAEKEAVLKRQQRLLTFVVIGGGPTGVELAGAIAEIAHHSLPKDFRHIDPSSARVILIEAGPSVISNFPEHLREAARRDLERLGVEVRTGSMVTDVTDHQVVVGTEIIEAETILWAAGVAASPLGATLDVPRDRAGRVLINPDLTIPGHSNVFVIGALSSLKGANGKPLPGVAQVAIQMGKHAAKNIVRAIGKEPYVPFAYRNLGDMATIGRAAAVADFGWFTMKGYIGWLAWLFVHIFNLVGFRNRIVVMVQWAWSYMTYQRAIRLITGRDDTTAARPVTELRSK